MQSKNLAFVTLTYYFQPYMFPIGLLLLFLKNYIVMGYQVWWSLAILLQGGPWSIWSRTVSFEGFKIGVHYKKFTRDGVTLSQRVCKSVL